MTSLAAILAVALAAGPVGMGPQKARRAGTIFRLLPAGGASTACTGQIFGSWGQTVTVTRATPATCLNVDGAMSTLSSGQLRVEGPGALFEIGRTNVALKSKIYDHATWQKITAGAAPAPQVFANDSACGNSPGGIQDADRVIFGATAATPNTDATVLRQTITYTAAAYSTATWLKTITGTAVLYVGVSSVGGNTVKANVTTAWRRFKQENKTLTAAARNIHIGLDSFEAHQLADLPLPSQTVCVWQTQSELGPHSTSDIEVDAAPVGRNADYATIAKPTGLSESEGCARTCVTPQWTGNAPLLSTYLDFAPTVSNRRIAYVSAGTDLFQAYNGTHNPGIAAGYIAGVTKCYLTQWSVAQNKFRVTNLASGASNETAFTAFPAFDATLYVGSAQTGAFAANGWVTASVGSNWGACR